MKYEPMVLGVFFSRNIPFQNNQPILLFFLLEGDTTLDEIH